MCVCVCVWGGGDGSASIEACCFSSQMLHTAYCKRKAGVSVGIVLKSITTSVHSVTCVLFDVNPGAKEAFYGCNDDLR